jgi:hypothetical protein
MFRSFDLSFPPPFDLEASSGVGSVSLSFGEAAGGKRHQRAMGVAKVRFRGRLASIATPWGGSR